jgi:hypothetical protein
MFGNYGTIFAPHQISPHPKALKLPQTANAVN